MTEFKPGDRVEWLVQGEGRLRGTVKYPHEKDHGWYTVIPDDGGYWSCAGSMLTLVDDDSPQYAEEYRAAFDEERELRSPEQLLRMEQHYIEAGLIRQNFTTKDSGTRAEFDSGMVRDTNQGKPRFDLLVPKGVPYSSQMITRFAELMARGAEKYDARNWEQATGNEELERFRESAFRHFMQWFMGETDEDHAAAITFNVWAAEYVRHRLQE